jgi:hypothetical protein
MGELEGEVRRVTTNLGGLELPESDVDGDTTLTLSLQLVEDPRVLEGTYGGSEGQPRAPSTEAKCRNVPLPSSAASFSL